ncbi:MAG: methyltransferase domain-containing protein [Oscillospiraceae bacterium]|jgi:23S rRNA (guanine745-N1)-methyltransferase|nr:methyltransferase domain-containing protein [Oscillospiraceae bacterium]
MKIDRARVLFKSRETALRCPLCGNGGCIKGASFVCSRGHCFDIAAKGYINFVPGQTSTGYSRTLFNSRRAVLEAGYFAPVLESVKQCVPTTPDLGGVILDAGCGEGYYAAGLALSGGAVIGMDLEKEAILTACRRQESVCWLVADINRIPLSDHAAAAVLNVLTPANYQEFSRVLAPGGLVVKVIPGKDYLSEIRAALGDRLRQQDYSSEPVAAHFARNLHGSDKTDIRYTLPVDADMRAHFFNMTPMTQHIDPATVDLDDLTHITIHLKVLVGTAPD